MSTHNICIYHNICIGGDIRKILCGYPLLSVAMYTPLIWSYDSDQIY